MKKLKIFATALLLSVCAVMPVQAQDNSGNGEPEYDYTFNRHWFIQAQGGVQYTLGEIPFAELLSPNVQIGLGYEFNPWLAARLSVDFWQSKAGVKRDADRTFKWSWNYVAPSIDAMFDITNLIKGFNPERKFGFGLFAGVGLNFYGKGDVESKREELLATYPAAWDMQTPIKYYDQKGLPFVGRLGTFADWHITDKWALGLEVQANFLTDKYNSVKANDNNVDWYFNGLLGIKYCFGKTHDKTPKVMLIPVTEAGDYAPACDPVEKIVEKTVQVPVEVSKPELYEEIYFSLNKDKVSQLEKYKVRRIVDFMNKYPEATIEISGHADRATGTASYNMDLSQRRAANVAKALKEAGIDESRIKTSAHGSAENPYDGEDMKLNRVCICVAK
ncbi:MAG: OmpA family protein [Bacteroidaceae bacterium]|nr:OmpA family protein [Bacteroidaceae bacterium]MBP5347923.1 OmpA family protein [Bacteroidaceae bacterium]